ncbi:LysE family translocator [Pseudomonas chlororaphis]|uniref:LysE family translocator n=1 Tax=Pseudomonas chlororaphis TaxID=587753 RepID=UPI001B322DAB|nr:LysE family translocator [Pseudomonas chlororaphis]MBP5057471.1 LysE family translocator [Pseudomonas chlororaphis]MBP5142048.1 LysE family translocator [Pseudomonas chlororaphis]
MDVTTALLSFSVAAALLTITPGLDTALVLRTAAVEGPLRAMLAGTGIVAGVLAWGLMAALGLGAVLAVSRLAFRAVQIVGAAYLIWMGLGMLRGSFRSAEVTGAATETSVRAPNWFVRGLMTNLLNPKVGVFYVSFLPQFLPAAVPAVPFSMLLTGIHAVLGLIFFTAITTATVPFQRALSGPRMQRVLDRITGVVLILFALLLLFERRTV